MARIGDTERLIWEQHATITDLRARLAEVEAELGRAVDAGAGPHVCQYAARLAEAEKALNEKRNVAVRFKNLYTETLARAESAEARLDEVEAERDHYKREADKFQDLALNGWPSAAARGEGDR